MFFGRDGRMRSEEADPQKVLRIAVARAGLVDYRVHTCRRCKGAAIRTASATRTASYARALAAE